MKEYINAKELQKITGLSYKSAMGVIEKVRKEMEKKGYFIPQSKTKIALLWMIKKELGIKGE